MRLLSNLVSSNRILKSSQVKFDKKNAVTIAHEQVAAPVPEYEPELEDIDYFNNPGGAFESEIRAENKEISDQELAERIIARAKDEAAKIIEHARADAELILDRMEQDARDGIRMMEEDACQRGYREGLEKGEAETEGIKTDARALIANAARERDESFAAFESEIVDLIADSLTKLLTKEININPKVILHIIRKGFSESKMSGDITIRVSDADYEATYESREEIQQYADAGAKLEILKDPSLTQGDCIIETPFGAIDCSLDQQSESLKKNLYFISENR